MRAALLLGTSLLALSGTIGCCGLSQCVREGEFCGQELVGNGCGLKKPPKHKAGCSCVHQGNCTGASCYAQSQAGCGAAVTASGQCGAPAALPTAGCGCGTGAAEPAPYSAPAPIPASESPSPPLAEPAPAPKPVPGGEVAPPPMASTGWKPSTAAPPQRVSYEEFQKLPGQLVPATAAPATMPIVTPGPQAAPAAPASNWAPARR